MEMGMGYGIKMSGKKLFRPLNVIVICINLRRHNSFASNQAIISNILQLWATSTLELGKLWVKVGFI